MGGWLKECGCYDGPWSPDDQRHVNVRCAAHRDEPGEGFSLVRLADGKLVPRQRVLNVRTKRRPLMAIPKGKRKGGRR